MLIVQTGDNSFGITFVSKFVEWLSGFTIRTPNCLQLMLDLYIKVIGILIYHFNNTRKGSVQT